MLKISKSEYAKHVKRTHETIMFWIEQGWLKTVGERGKGGVKIPVCESSEERLKEITSQWLEWKALNVSRDGSTIKGGIAWQTRTKRFAREAILEDLVASGHNSVKDAVAQIVADEIEKFTRQSRSQPSAKPY